MFKLVQTESYFWPVTVEMPVNGKFEKSTFDAEFKRLPNSRLTEIYETVDRPDFKTLDLCNEILIGWKGVADESGSEIPFSETSKESLLNVQLVKGAIVRAFFESLSGSKRKN